MRLQIKTAKLLNALKTLELFNSEAVIKVNQEGLKISQIDGANVSFYDLTIKKEEFNIFLVEKEELIGFNVKNLLDSIKNHKKSELSLTLDENNIYLDFNNGFKAELKKISLDDLSIKELPQTLEYKTILEAEVKPLSYGIKTFKDFDGVKFSYCLNNTLNKYELIIKTQGNLNNSSFSPIITVSFISISLSTSAAPAPTSTPFFILIHTF